MIFSMKKVVLFLAAAVLATTWAAAPATASSTAVAWKTPNLSSRFIPQGMTTWGKYVLMAEYKPGSNTRLVAVSPSSGKIYGQVSIAENHAGGIALVGGWLFVQDQPHETAEAIRRYKLIDLTAAMKKSHSVKKPAYLKSAGLQQLAKWQYASFMTADGAQLLSGHYGMGESARMYRYNVDQKTGQVTSTGYVHVPDRVQGVGLYGKTPVYASHLRLTYGSTVLAIPDHAEGLVVLKGVAYVAFEGNSPNVLKIKL